MRNMSLKNWVPFLGMYGLEREPVVRGIIKKVDPLRIIGVGAGQLTLLGSSVLYFMDGRVEGVIPAAAYIFLGWKLNSYLKESRLLSEKKQLENQYKQVTPRKGD